MHGLVEALGRGGLVLMSEDGQQHVAWDLLVAEEQYLPVPIARSVIASSAFSGLVCCEPQALRDQDLALRHGNPAADGLRQR